jgi:hypothetical protein
VPVYFNIGTEDVGEIPLEIRSGYIGLSLYKQKNSRETQNSLGGFIL